MMFKTEGELRRAVRDALISVTSAFVLSRDDDTNIALMNDLLSAYMESPEFNVRHVYIGRSELLVNPKAVCLYLCV